MIDIICGHHIVSILHGQDISPMRTEERKVSKAKPREISNEPGVSNFLLRLTPLGNVLDWHISGLRRTHRQNVE